jgi:hypothetical protein
MGARADELARKLEASAAEHLGSARATTKAK